MRGRRSRMTLSLSLGLPKARPEGSIRATRGQGQPEWQNRIREICERRGELAERSQCDRTKPNGPNGPNVTERSQTETPTRMERRAMRGRRPEVNWQNEAKRKSRVFSKEA